MADVAAKIAAYFHRRGYALRFRGSTRLFAARLNPSYGENDRNAVHMRKKEGDREGGTNR